MAESIGFSPEYLNALNINPEMPEEEVQRLLAEHLLLELCDDTEH